MCGYSIGYDPNWDRDIGYGVPSICDHPECHEEIDRGLGYVCGNDVFGGEDGCGLFFCENHRVNLKGQCQRCNEGKEPFEPKPDVKQWKDWKLTHESWSQWREENPDEVEKLKGIPEARTV